jgi:hypothetical protein
LRWHAFGSHALEGLGPRIQPGFDSGEEARCTSSSLYLFIVALWMSCHAKRPLSRSYAHTEKIGRVVHLNQITSWKAQLESGAADVFAPGGGSAAQPAIDVKSLHAKIGELTLENDS